MDEQMLSTQICKTPDELKASHAAEIVMLEGLGKPIRIFLRNPKDEVVGGVIANCFGGWVYIALLWVEKSLRNQGYGTRLMQLLEAEAVQNGCQHAHLDTYSFEARPFYERLAVPVSTI
jgi:GNAT superfamily N-acetyltransferase